MSQAPPSRIQRAAANLGLAVISTASLLGILEGAARLYDAARGGVPLALPDPMKELYQTHPYLPVVLKPSTDYRDADTSGRINSLGMRGAEREARKPAGAYRILCVGGSTTFGAGIAGDENTYPARLERILGAARPDLPIEVWNAGVPGYTTAENVIYLSLRLLSFEPDLVVIYDGYNDFKPNRYPGFRADYAHWRDRETSPQRSWLDRSRLYARMRALLGRALPDAEAEVRDPRGGEKLHRFDTVGAEGLDVFGRNLRTMIAAARSAGADVALATYAHPCTQANREAHPDLFKYMPGYLPNLTFEGAIQAFDAYNEAIRDVAAGSRTLLADAARAIPADAALFVDHVHHNPQGAEAFARVVADAILPALPAPARREAASPVSPAAN